jgi:hypothetical protein
MFRLTGSITIEEATRVGVMACSRAVLMRPVSRCRSNLLIMSRGHIDTRILAAAWLLAAGIGLLASADYDSRPSVAAGAPERWPKDLELERDTARPTLLMFLHPRCPCSAASLYELRRLTHDARGRLAAVVILVQPIGVPDSWTHTELWTDAVADGELQVVIDAEGAVADRFAVHTSGQGLLYDRRGMLQFAGGITAGRGHAGDSVGRARILSLLNGKTVGLPARCAVFGCALAGSDARTRPGPQAK